MSIYLGCDQYLTLHSNDMIKLPAVSGTGSSEFGDYTVGGTFDAVTGGGEYELKFEWGECTMSVEPRTASSDEMIGVASLECSGERPAGFCEFSDTGSVTDSTVTEAIGDGANVDKIILGEHKAVYVLKRNDGKTIVANGVLALYPKFVGHGDDDYKGSYKIVSNSDTSLSNENQALIEYDVGITIQLKFKVELGPDGKFKLIGTFLEQPNNQKPWVALLTFSVFYTKISIPGIRELS